MIEFLSQNWWTGVAAIVALIALFCSFRAKGTSQKHSEGSNSADNSNSNTIKGFVLGNASINTSLVNMADLRPAQLEIVEVGHLIDCKTGPNIDIKFRNPSPQIVFIKRAEITIHDFRVVVDRNLRGFPVSVSAQYHATLPFEKKTVSVKMSQAIKANDVDRVVLSLKACVPYLQGMSVFLIELKFIFNEHDQISDGILIVCKVPLMRGASTLYAEERFISNQDNVNKTKREAKALLEFVKQTSRKKNLVFIPSLEEIIQELDPYLKEGSWISLEELENIGTPIRLSDIFDKKK